MNDPAAGYEALMQFLYQTPIGVVQTTLDGRITMINPMSARMLMPLCPDGDLGNLFAVLREAAPGLRECAQAAAYPGGIVCEGLQLTTGPAASDGSAATTLSLRLLRLEADLLMCSVSDVTAEVRLARQQLADGVHRANRTDALTALPNRAELLERIELELQRSRADPAYGFAVLCINGDRFGRVNVMHGPACGDELLRTMGERIVGALRQRDAVGSAGPRTAGRLGMDEFVVVLEGVGSNEPATAVAQRLVDTLRMPYLIQQTAVYIAASVGIVVRPVDAADAGAVLRDAGFAMREAKRCGGARASLFRQGLKDAAFQRASLERDLRDGIEQGQLFVVFQPIVRLDGGGAAGVEALVRWRHPTRGVVSPLEFIGVAEETGLIVPLGLFVLRSACRTFAGWQQQLGSQATGVLSVNLSRAQLADAALVGQVRQAIDDSGLLPSSLQLEITESLAAESAQIQQRLHELKALGIRLALDDFGTGHSSLSSLHQWPVDVIKIDRSFVTLVATSHHHRVLVEATVRVAASLEMDTVAEGVETAEQATVLRSLQCAKAQGYFYARPLPADEAAGWLAARMVSTAVARRDAVVPPPDAPGGTAPAAAREATAGKKRPVVPVRAR